MEQLVARWAHNPKAVGSSPAPATLKALAFMPGFFFVQFFDEFFVLKVWSWVDQDSYPDYSRCLESAIGECHPEKPNLESANRILE